MSRGASLKEIEEFPRRIRIFVIILIFLFLIGTLGFKFLSHASFSDCFYRTLETLAFIFEDDPSIGERLLEVFLAVIGVFFVWWILWSVADMLLDGSLSKYLKTKMYNIILMDMKNHIIIAGGGRSGEEVAKILSEKKKKFVMIDNNELVIKNLKKKKYIAILGNAESDEVLIKAGIKKAQKIIITLPKTEANILITLTAKELNPEIDVYARCENNKIVSKLKKVGAKVAIVPEVVAGDKLAESLEI